MTVNPNAAGNSTPENSNNGPWGETWQKDIPPFDREQAEANRAAAEQEINTPNSERPLEAFDAEKVDAIIELIAQANDDPDKEFQGYDIAELLGTNFDQPFTDDIAKAQTIASLKEAFAGFGAESDIYRQGNLNSIIDNSDNSINRVRSININIAHVFENSDNTSELADAARQAAIEATRDELAAVKEAEQRLSELAPNERELAQNRIEKAKLLLQEDINSLRLEQAKIAKQKELGESDDEQYSSGEFTVLGEKSALQKELEALTLDQEAHQHNTGYRVAALDYQFEKAQRGDSDYTRTIFESSHYERHLSALAALDSRAAHAEADRIRGDIGAEDYREEIQDIQESRTKENNRYEAARQQLHFQTSSSSQEQAEANRTAAEQQEQHEQLNSQPDYLQTMPPERWEQIVNTSAQFSQDFPDSVLMGGTALRLLYAADTGELPFGEGGGDLDTFVPAESLTKYRNNLPEGYELVNTGENKDDRICVRTPSGEEVDVFGWSDHYEPIEIEVDGKIVRVESLNSLIASRIDLAKHTDLLENNSDNPQQDKAKRDKYGFYAQKLLEIADQHPDQINETKLPSNWRDILLVMSTKGEYGAQPDEDSTITAEREREVREQFAQEAEKQRRIEEARKRFMDELKAYFEQNHNSPHPAEPPATLAELLSGYENIIINRLTTSFTSDSFIQGIMSTIGQDGVKTVSDRINNSVK